MINELFLSDFKAFHKEHIALKPLTVLIGENNSGKSSVLAAIRLLAQTAQHEDISVPLLLDGPFGDFGGYRDVVHGNHRGRPMTLGLTVPYLPRGQVLHREDRDARKTITLSCDFKYRLQRRETILRSVKLQADGETLISAVRSANSERLTLQSVAGLNVPPTMRSPASLGFRMNHFVPLVNPLFTTSQSELARTLHERVRNDRSFRYAGQSITNALRSVDVIGAMREAPLRTYLHTGTVGSRIGVSGENWGSFVALEGSGRERQTFMSDVRKWMRKAGIAQTLRAKWLSDRHYEIVVTHPVSGEEENISDVGRGTSQVLPVVIGGYRLRRGDTYLVEEPEIHLHPRAQAALGDYFLDLVAKNGVQAIVETHSEYLIMRLQQHVAAGRISPEDIIFYYLQATKDGKKLRTLRMTDEAVFEDPIPGGFFPQRMQEASNLAKARGQGGAK